MILELPPIASHTGQMREEERGYIKYGDGFKLPEPVLKGCISVAASLKPMEHEPRVNLDQIDTTLFVYYNEDKKVKVRNFADARVDKTRKISNFEDEMIIGSWKQTQFVEPIALHGAYYSNTMDYRKRLSPYVVTTKIKGFSLGYGKPKMAFNPFWMSGILYRHKYYAHEINIVKERGNAFSVSMYVPYYMRNTLMYASTSVTGSINKEIRTSGLKPVADPNSYAVWTYDEALHWAPWGLTDSNFLDPSTLQGSFPKDGKPVWVEHGFYKKPNTVAGEFADNGDWVGGIPADVTHLYNSDGSPPAFNPPEPTEDETKATNEYEMKCDTIFGVRKVNNDNHRDEYYWASPDPLSGNVMYEDGCKICFGGSQYQNVSYNLTDRKRFGYTSLADHTEAHNFLGVINE